MISDGTLKTVISQLLPWIHNFKNSNYHLYLDQFHGQDENLSLISLHKSSKAVLIPGLRSRGFESLRIRILVNLKLRFLVKILNCSVNLNWTKIAYSKTLNHDHKFRS